MKNSYENQNSFPVKQLFPLVMILAAFFIISCGGGQDRVQHQQLNELKGTTTENLNSIIDEIDERIEYLDEEISNASGNRKAELEDARNDLNNQKKLLEEEIENIEVATLENWNDVIENTSEVTVSVRARTNEISREVREMLEN